MRRQKDAKRQRERTREVRKIEYHSASLIQRTFKRFLNWMKCQRTLNAGVDIMLDYLRYVKIYVLSTVDYYKIAVQD